MQLFFEIKQFLLFVNTPLADTHCCCSLLPHRRHTRKNTPMFFKAHPI